MTLKTPEERIQQTTDLLRSLQDSIGALRQKAEDLRQRIEAGEDSDLIGYSKDIARVETLIRACQKVEASLVEQQDRHSGHANGCSALDLEQARFEIGCRLARLRTCCDPGGVSE
jgi:septal ring factor EnvC (AmiA/AmiB activator)